MEKIIKTIKIRNITIGEGLPKICVPLLPEDLNGLREEIANAKDSGCDLVEWRIDRLDTWCGEVSYIEKEEALSEIREGIEIIRREADIPIVLTLRTAEEGGLAKLGRREYYSSIRDIIENCDPMNSKAPATPDFIDIEAFAQEEEHGSDKVEFIVNMAQEKGIATILSNHDFHETPTAEEIVRRICVMDSLGADIPKVAYMPQGDEDVHAVIQAAHAASEFCDKPFIALSMGEEGLPSRICSGASGSAVTFASLGGQSAPGQINVSDMRALLKEFYSK